MTVSSKNALIQVHALDLFEQNPFPREQEEEVETVEQESTAWGDDDFRVQTGSMNVTSQRVSLSKKVAVL